MDNSTEKISMAPAHEGRAAFRHNSQLQLVGLPRYSILLVDLWDFGKIPLSYGQ